AIQHAVILRAISFTATPPTPIPALSLHDALPILCGRPHPLRPVRTFARRAVFVHNQYGGHLSRKGKDMTQNTIATAADYADAMITARRAKNWLFGILLLILLAQLAIFFTVAFGPEHLATHSTAPSAVIEVDMQPEGGDATTAPVGVELRTDSDAQQAAAAERSFGSRFMEWVVGGT